MRPRIQRLSTALVNKIAAGEVIERPANVVKELVENSVDAGATRVNVEVVGGGMELVRVSDNGCGIPEEEIALALASHATSKLRTDEDLFRVKTLGFRGEALASLAAVSRLKLVSRTPEQASAIETEIVGGEQSHCAPVGASVGTSIEIRDLFFNTPVRRKFLRSPQTEASHVVEAFQRIALAYPQVHFTLKQNDRVTFDLPAIDVWKERIAAFHGFELAEGLIAVESEQEGVRLSGYVANPTHSRANNKQQYLFLNGRFIRDRSLQHALGEAYRGLLLVGRFPICFLKLDMPPELVDVNVHPTKLEVRFQDGSRHYSQLLGTLRNRFLSTDLVARWKSQRPVEDGESHGQEISAASAHAQRENVRDWAAGALWDRSVDFPTPNRVAAAVEWQLPPHSRGLTLHDVPPMPAAHFGVTAEQAPFSPRTSQLPALSAPPSTSAVGVSESVHSSLRDLATSGGLESPPLAQGAESPNLSHEGAGQSVTMSTQTPNAHALSGADGLAPQALQVLNRYLVAESPEGVVIIDQHALHERILYEEIRNKVLARQLEVQRLLVPEPIEFSPRELAVVLESQQILAAVGVEVEAFGGSTLLVRGYPAMLRRFDADSLLRELADLLGKDGKAVEPRDLLDHLMHSMACKAAVKAGDPLAPAEIDALLAQRHVAQDHHHCPHGRPTTIVFTREELDRQFRRT